MTKSQNNMSKKPERDWLRIGLSGVSILGALAAIWTWRVVKYNDSQLSDDPLWKWFELLIVPSALVAGTFILNRLQKQRDDKAKTAGEEERQKQERSNYQQTLLGAYIDFIDRNVARAKPNDAQIAMIRARTLTTLGALEDNSLLRAAIFTLARETELLSTIGVFSNYKHLQNRNFADADLTGANFNECDLSGSNFKASFLHGANLIGANLSRADLSNARLNRIIEGTEENIIQSEADATNAILNGATLMQAELTRCRLVGAQLRGAKLQNAILESADLSGADLTGACLEGANMKDAILDGATLHETMTDAQTVLDRKWELVRQIVNGELESFTFQEETDLTRANLNRANVSHFMLQKARLAGANLDWVTAHGANLKSADLSRAICTNADFSDADLSGADLSGADLSHAILSRCNLRDATLDSSTQIEQKWYSVWAILHERPLERASNMDLLSAEPENPWDLMNTSNRGPNLSGYDLNDAYLDGSDLNHVNLRGAELRGAVLTDVIFDAADLSLADLRQAKIARKQLQNANIEGARLPEQFLDD